ncbi:MAG: hypothetical protein IPG85_10010 [Bacteroidetes bacterium]|nr:hypothetical protein [Bacteroidota bacterium]
MFTASVVEPIDALGNATNLCAGTVYTITVTDANACTGTTSIQVNGTECTNNYDQHDYSTQLVYRVVMERQLLLP